MNKFYVGQLVTFRNDVSNRASGYAKQNELTPGKAYRVVSFNSSFVTVFNNKGAHEETYLHRFDAASQREIYEYTKRPFASHAEKVAAYAAAYGGQAPVPRSDMWPAVVRRPPVAPVPPKPAPATPVKAPKPVRPKPQMSSVVIDATLVNKLIAKFIKNNFGITQDIEKVTVAHSGGERQFTVQLKCT